MFVSYSLFMMKFLCIGLLLICHANVFGQAFHDEPRHDFKVGIGAFPLLFGGIDGNYGLYDDATWKMVDLLDRDCRGDLRTTGCIFGSYSYRLLKWLKLGASVSYLHFWRDYASGDESSTYIFAMPFVEFAWLNRKYFRMYSALGVGVDFVKVKDSGISKNDSYSEAGVQLTYLGMSVGSKLFGFAELGVGNRGLVSAGIGYRF